MKRNVTAALVSLALYGGSPVKAAEIPSDLEIDEGSLSVSRKELVCLALNDYWESRGEPLEGRLAVAQVVLNRVMDTRFPDNLCDVVMQHHRQPVCQFSWACDGRPDDPTDETAWRESLILASAVLDRQSGLQDQSGGAKWFHSTHVKPSWSNRFEVSRRIARHVFYRDASEPQPDTEGPPDGFTGWLEERLNDPQVAVNVR